MNKLFRRTFQFFLKHAGYRVGYHAQDALRLARAERWAELNGYTFEWKYDDDGHDTLGDHEYWCSDARREKAGYNADGEQVPSYSRYNTHEHEITYCVMSDSDGEHLESLSGIIDASNDYRRVVQAELAVEQMPDLAEYLEFIGAES